MPTLRAFIFISGLLQALCVVASPKAVQARSIGRIQVTFRMGESPDWNFPSKVGFWGWRCTASGKGTTPHSVLLPDGRTSSRDTVDEESFPSPWIFGKDASISFDRDLNAMGLTGVAQFSVECSRINANINSATDSKSSSRKIVWTCKIPTIPTLVGASVETSCENEGAKDSSLSPPSYGNAELEQFQKIPVSVQWTLLSAAESTDLDLCGSSQANRMTLHVLQGLAGFGNERSFSVLLLIGNLAPVVLRSKDGIFDSEIAFCPDSSFVKISAHGYESGLFFDSDYGAGELTLGPFEPDNWGKIHMARQTVLPWARTLESDLLLVLSRSVPGR